MREFKEVELLGYLLGESSTFDQDAIESRLFQDNDFFERLQAIRVQLIRDYLCGNLPLAERESFERELASNAQLFSLVAELYAIKLADKQLGNHSWRSFAKPFTVAFRVPVAVVLLFCVVFFGIAYQGWVLRTERAHFSAELKLIQLQTQKLQTQKVNDELEAANGRLTAIPAARLVSIFPYTQFRGGGGNIARPRVPRGSDLIIFSLVLDTDRLLPLYKVTITSVGGYAVWSQDGMRTRRIGGRNTIELTVDSALLEPNDYLVKVAGRTRQGGWRNEASYVFTVTR